MGETPPVAHALRIEAVNDARHEFLLGHHVAVYLDDKPLSYVRSVAIRIGFDEITTATFCVEVGKVEIPNGLAALQVEHVQDDLREH
jgi:hypothetical protein